MGRSRKHLLLSLLAVGSVGAAALLRREGLLGRRSRLVGRSPSGAQLRARVVERPPDGATVVDADGAVLDGVPAAREVVRRAVARDAREEWACVLVEGHGAERAVERLHRELPHFSAPNGDDAAADGVYVALDGEFVRLTAVGWTVTGRTG